MSNFLIAKNELKKNFEFVEKYSPEQDTEPFSQRLELITRLSRTPPDRTRAMRFLRGLLASPRYRKLHAHVWMNLAYFYSGRRKESLLLRALKRSRTSLDRIAMYRALAIHYSEENQPIFQRAYLDRIIRLYESGFHFKQAAWAFRESGDLLLRRMAAHSALDHFLRSLEIEGKGQTAGRSCLGVAISMGMVNKPGLEEKYLKRALDNARKYHLDFLKIRALSLYGQMLMENNRLDQAKKYLNLSLESERKSRKYVCGRDSLFRQALIEERMGSSAKAISILKRAVQIGIRAGDMAGMLPVIAFLADRLIASGEIKQCRNLLVRMDDLFAPYHPHYFLYYYLRGRVCEHQGEIDKAELFYTHALDSLRKKLPGFSFSSRSFWREWLHSLYNHVLLFKLSRYESSSRRTFLVDAIRLHEEKNRLITSCIVRRGSRALSLIREEKRLQSQYERYISDWAVSNDDHSRAGSGMDRLLNHYREFRELLTDTAGLYPVADSTRLNLTLFQSHISEGRLVLKFMLLEEKVVVVCMSRTHIHLQFLPGERRNLINDVIRLIAPLDDFSSGRVDYLRIHFDLPLANALYELLLGPVKKNLEGIRELVLIPDGDLFRLPFDALVTGFNRGGSSTGVIFSEYGAANYLIQEYRISLATSLENLDRDYIFAEKNPIDIVAFGGPVFFGGDGPAGSRESMLLKGMSTLPTSLREVRSVRDLFPRGSCRLFIGESFTINNFRRFAPRARIVHVATHYMPNIESPWNSGLIFSRDPLAPSDSLYLLANEVQHIPLQAELVVLSACESSDQRILGLTGMAGMLAAISENGVRAGLVSMWPVDEYSSMIFPTFYRQYRNHRDSSRALRRAKMEMIQSEITINGTGRMSLAHPFLWSNFQVFRFRR